MLKMLISLFGGRAAEAIALGDISTGASNDLQRASEICRGMVKKYGMTEAIGPVVYDEGNNQVFLGKDYGQVNNYSEETSSRIDKEVERLMREAYAKTLSILKEHYDKLELVAETLMEKEKLDGKAFVSLMENGVLPVVEEKEETSEKEESFVSETETVTESEGIAETSSEEKSEE